MDAGHLQPSQTVLVQGTGGVSLFAAQIASAFGATVIATSSRGENLERVKAFGAQHGINYRTSWWAHFVGGLLKRQTEFRSDGLSAATTSCR